LSYQESTDVPFEPSGFGEGRFATDSPLEEDGFELLVPLSDAAIAKSRGSLRKVSKQLGDRRFDSFFLRR
jgi:hypothetical protein